MVKNVRDSYWFLLYRTKYCYYVCEKSENMPVLNLKQEKVKLRCLYTCENDVVRTITCFVLLCQREREDHTCYK